VTRAMPASSTGVLDAAGFAVEALDAGGLVAVGLGVELGGLVLGAIGDLRVGHTAPAIAPVASMSRS